MNSDKLLKLAYEFEKFSEEPQFVYHIKNPEFSGEIIYPFSDLKKNLPDIYKKEKKKYKDRPEHLEQKIDILKCEWQDCVNLSTLDPRKIFDLQKLLGVPGYDESSNIEIFKFNIVNLADHKFCLYNDDNSSYEKVTLKGYKETKFIPNETVKYFMECADKKEYPLLFAGVKHLMVKGPVSTLHAEIIKYE